jgi:hypothetical protein
MSTRERNERFSERHGGEDVNKGKKGPIQQAARRGRHRQSKGMSDAVSGAAGKTSTSDRNERFSERRGGQDVCND